MAVCCSPIGGKLSEAQLAELVPLLAAVGAEGAESLGSIAARYGVSKSTLSKHKSACLGIKAVGSLGGVQPAPLPMGGASVLERTRTVLPSVSRARGEDEGPPNVGSNVGGATVSQNVLRTPQNVLAASSVPALDEAKRLEESRIDQIADMVRFALWKNRGTTQAMAAQWKLPEREVNRLHRIACRRLSSARGGPVAQREQSVAICSLIRDEMLEHASKLDKEAALCAKAEEWKAAQINANLAATARSTALTAQRQIDQWTQKDASLVVNVNQGASESDDFKQVWDAVGTMLDAWAPGLRAKIEEGLGVLEDRGEKGLREFVAEVASDRTALVVSGEAVG